MLFNSGAGKDSWESVDLQGDQTSQYWRKSTPRIFIGMTGAEAETSKLWPSNAKGLFIGKDSKDGKDWRQKEKGAAKDDMVRWHHQPNGHESEQTLVVEDRGAWHAAIPGVQRVRHNLASIATTTAKRRLFFQFFGFYKYYCDYYSCVCLLVFICKSLIFLKT